MRIYCNFWTKKSNRNIRFLLRRKCCFIKTIAPGHKSVSTMNNINELHATSCTIFTRLSPLGLFSARKLRKMVQWSKILKQWSCARSYYSYALIRKRKWINHTLGNVDNSQNGRRVGHLRSGIENWRGSASFSKNRGRGWSTLLGTVDALTLT